MGRIYTDILRVSFEVYASRKTLLRHMSDGDLSTYLQSITTLLEQLDCLLKQAYPYEKVVTPESQSKDIFEAFQNVFDAMEQFDQALWYFRDTRGPDTAKFLYETLQVLKAEVSALGTRL